jgi:hypothetical protein
VALFLGHQTLAFLRTLVFFALGEVFFKDLGYHKFLGLILLGNELTLLILLALELDLLLLLGVLALLMLFALEIDLLLKDLVLDSVLLLLLNDLEDDGHN